MRLGLFLTTLVGLAGASHISSAADATWAAVGALENGMSTSCGGGTVSTGPEWTAPANGQVDIRGTRSLLKVQRNSEPFIHRRFEGVAA